MLFHWVLVYQYLFCPSGGYATEEYAIVVMASTGGRSIALGCTFLGLVYHSLARLTMDAPFSKADGHL